MDHADLEQLHARLEKPMYNVAFRWTWREEDAHDLVQEAFVRLWGMRRRVDLATVEPLAYRILINLAASRARKRKRWRWVSLDAVRETGSRGQGGERGLLDGERRERARRALATLSEESRRIVVLAECTSMTHAEIGRSLGLAEGTVGSRRHRALKQLRRWLAREGAGDERISAESS